MDYLWRCAAITIYVQRVPKYFPGALFAYYCTIRVTDFDIFNVRWDSKLKNIMQIIDSVEWHLTSWRTYTSRLEYLVNILLLCAESLRTTIDSCDGFGSHGPIEANANDSNNSLYSFFEYPTNPDNDSMDRNSSFDHDW